MERTYTEEEHKTEEEKMITGMLLLGAGLVGTYVLGGVLGSSRTRHNHNRYIKGYKSGFKDAHNGNINKL